MRHDQDACQVDEAVQSLPGFAQALHPPAKGCNREQGEDGESEISQDHELFFLEDLQEGLLVELVIQTGEDQEVQGGVKEGEQPQRAAKAGQDSVPGECIKWRAGEGEQEKDDGKIAGALGGCLDGVDRQVAGKVSPDQPGERQPASNQDERVKGVAGFHEAANPSNGF